MMNIHPSCSILYCDGLALQGGRCIRHGSGQTNTETIHPFKAFVHLLAFYLLFTHSFVFLLAYMQVFRAIIHGMKLFLCFWSVVCCVMHVSLNRILVHVKTTQYQIQEDYKLLKPVRIALIADLHIGLFSRHERQLKPSSND